MQLFLYEYTCSADPTDGPAAASLRAEGWAMRAAVLEDFGRLPGVEIVTLGHDTFAPGQRCRVFRADPEEPIFRELAAASDFTLVIAPELDNLLLTRCTWVEEGGGRLLGPSAAAVRLTGDKWALGQYLRRRRIATPESRLISGTPMNLDLSYPLVWKPRFGAGSVATFLVRDSEDWPRCCREARAEGWRGESLVQTWVPGRPASVALLLGPRQCVPLRPATQELSDDGRLHYLGGRLPLPPPLAERAISLARRAVASVPGLTGYVGVDLILGDAADGSRDCVIEINPRLTTSYVGLRALCRDNLAEAMLRVVRGDELPAISWNVGPVRFNPDGTTVG